jgi:starvation-inducible DNA-binding protein
MTKKNSATQIVEHLANVLSDTYVLAIKTHGYHWNVKGPLFPQLHAMFSEQYEALLEASDEVAERIRVFDMPAPGSMEAFLARTCLKEAGDQSLTAAAMVKDLLKSHEMVRARVAETCNLAGEMEDKATEDLMIGRLEAHDKVIWMLRAQTE